MRPPAGPDQRKVRGELRRDRILEVATVHFGRRGYGGARLVDIAAEAGVTDAGLLHHFPTKKALFEAVVARRDSTYAGMWDPANVTARPDVRRLHRSGADRRGPTAT